MVLRSIRWRLPLSYALIALLAALVLGTVLTTTLRGYYAEREVEYLQRHASGASARAGELFQAGVPAEAIRAQFQSIAFLTQARIRVLDSDGTVLVDTGEPDNQQVIVSYTRQDDGSVINQSTGADTPAYAAVMYLDNNGNTLRISRTDETGENLSSEVIPPLARIDFEASVTSELTPDVMQSGSVYFEPTEAAQPIVGSYRLAAPALGMALTANEMTSPIRSDQRIEVPVIGSDGSTVGYVQMFDGIAYGSAIVKQVRASWAVASVVAVVLAAGVGWFVSRGISAPLVALTNVTEHMAKGNLSARARMKRRDEIGRLSQSFDEMADRVEDMVNTLRRFVGDAAHELHTPLTALNANLELAAQESDEARRQSFLIRAREQAERLKSLTSDLLDLSRLESNRGADTRSIVSLTALVREMGEIYASRAEQKGVAFSLDLPPDNVLVQANEGQIRRVIGNLLDNAIKFTPEDGAVVVGLACAGQRVELWVRDTGIGIPQEDMPLLFHRFHRGRNTAAFPGSGLGLAIIKAIVEAHQGDVVVASGARGTRFAVMLPAAAQH